MLFIVRQIPKGAIFLLEGDSEDYTIQRGEDFLPVESWAARFWMPAAMRCLHHEDGARAKSGQSHVPLTIRYTSVP